MEKEPGSIESEERQTGSLITASERNQYQAELDQQNSYESGYHLKHIVAVLLLFTIF